VLVLVWRICRNNIFIRFFCQIGTIVPNGSTFAHQNLLIIVNCQQAQAVFKEMSKEDKNKANGSPIEDQATEEKIFDFDKANPEMDKDAAGNEVNHEVSELQASVQELKEKHLRLLADFDNYKKRTMRERLELINSAARDVIVSLLPVLDDFHRAKLSADDPENEEHFSEGVSLVYNRLNTILQNQGLAPMASTGEKFDPELHEALTEVPVQDEEQKGVVVDTIETGYTLNDKIIRHAKVVVGK
jgi:molecular chaperone GrpE